jgi:urate oxidase
MAHELTWNRYGKSSVRLLKVRRATEPHEIVDLTMAVALEGAFEPVYTDGDNTSCLTTDAMKNTVYAFARQDPLDHVEALASRLVDHFAAKTGVTLARVDAIEHPWTRLSVGGQPHPHAFARAGAEEWTTVVTQSAGQTSVGSGVRGLVVLKTADSAFAGFLRDPYTTLPETRDRLLGTSVTATWQYAAGFADFGARNAIRGALVETFAAHKSESVQHTLNAMGEAALAACAGVAEITISLPNHHYLLADLAPFGLDNPGEIFVATDRPYGLIEARLSRRSGAGQP